MANLICKIQVYVLAGTYTVHSIMNIYVCTYSGDG